MKIWALYVVPSHRRIGIGKKLLAEVDEVKKLAQLEAIELESHVKNADAISFYSSLGFQKRMVQMVRYST